MLDIALFREEKGGNPELIRESQRRRFADPALVDRVIKLDAKWRDAQYKVERQRTEFNALNKQIGNLKKEKKDTAELQEQSKQLKKDKEATEELVKEVEAARDKAIVPIGNLVPDSVPISKDEAKAIVIIGNLVPDSVPFSKNEAENEVVKTWGQPREEEKLHNHVAMVQMLDIADLESGTAVAGGRGYFLKGEGVLLNLALIQCALAHAVQRGCTPVQTPFFMRQDAMAECAQLGDFDEQLYKVSGEGDDKYLIATSEQPLCAMHRRRWLEEPQLPLKYVGYSTCFRKEAGSHGRDTLGIFRVHQFEKVEQFTVTSPHNNASWKALDEMLANAEDFYQHLGLPYQVVNIVSGELNSAAAKKYDLEAWFPAGRTFRELVSCSNCTDYQSRRLECRLRTPKMAGVEPKKEYVHMLNATLTATERTLCCILETYQTPEGFRVPDALKPFMAAKVDFIPWKKRIAANGKLVDL